MVVESPGGVKWLKSFALSSFFTFFLLYGRTRKSSSFDSCPYFGRKNFSSRASTHFIHHNQIGHVLPPLLLSIVHLCQKPLFCSKFSSKFQAQGLRIFARIRPSMWKILLNASIWGRYLWIKCLHGEQNSNAPRCFEKMVEILKQLLAMSIKQKDAQSE